VRVRIAFMVLVAGFMVWGPFQRQALKEHHPYLRQWVMFANYGKDICDVRFYRTQDNNSYERLDRCELLGWSDCDEMFEGWWRVNTFAEVNRQVRKACEEQDDDPTLRVWARCGSPTSWRPLYRGMKPMCDLETIH